MASGTDLLAVARTDSEAATLITSTIDHRDHGFILGVTNPALQPLNDLMVAAEQSGKSGDALQAIEDQWMSRSGLKLYDEAVEEMINAGVHVDKPGLIQQYRSTVKGRSNSEARAIAKGLTGVDIHWDWDAPRTREGYYRYRGGCGCAINRAIAYAPYADMIWMESKLPDFKQAEEFANGVRAVWPEQKSAFLCRIPSLLLTDEQARLQSFAFFQLEDSHASGRKSNVHQTTSQARVLLAIHHIGRPAHNRPYLRSILEGVCQGWHAGVRRADTGT